MRNTHELTLVTIEDCVHDAIASQVDTASNDTLAAIAWEAFVNACDALDVPCRVSTFDALFPVYAELI